MAEARTINTEHPAPHRERGELGAIAFGLVGAPLAWALQLVINYGVASHACFPGAVPHALGSPPIWLTLLGVELIALVIAVAAALTSYTTWRATRDEASGKTRHMLEAGEGRTRFLALWGLMTSVGFLIALLFSLVGLFVVPLCGF